MKPLIKWLILLPLLRKIGKMLNYVLGWMFRPFHPIFAFIASVWQGFSPFVKNLVFGLLIALLLFGLRHGQWVAEIEDLSVDWMMTLYRVDMPKKASPPYVILDIDEKTYQSWEEPFVTPRDKLLKLLKFAVEAHPKLIIVDIAITDRASFENKGLHHDDKALLDYLANYEAHYCQSSCPPILLARSFRIPVDKRPFDPNTEPFYMEQRRTFLDNVVARSPHLYWAATLFEREHDRILRRWQLWATTCTQNSSEVVPSMPLLAATLLVGDNQPSPSSCRLRIHLDYYTPLDCTEGPQIWTDEALQHKPTTFKLNENLTFNLQPTRLSRRILYTLPWYLNKGEWWPYTLDNRPLISTISAKIILENQSDNGNSLKPMSNESLRDSITLIGASHLESRDWHPTPLGWMPGMLVLVNSIHSLLQYGILHPPSPWIVLSLTILLITFISWLLAKYQSFWGTIYAIGIIVILIPASIVLFKYGLWLSFAIPWAAIQLRQMIDF
jgi:CHASE2 domain-containing sensor protein